LDVKFVTKIQKLAILSHILRHAGVGVKQCNFRMLIYKVAQKRGHLVLRLVTLEVFMRLAPNLAESNVILFLTLLHNLFETKLENKVALSLEWQALVDFQSPALQRAEQTTVKCPSSFQFRTDFCRCAAHFHNYRRTPLQVRCFPKFRRANWSRRATLPFGRSVTPAELIGRSTYYVFGLSTVKEVADQHE